MEKFRELSNRKSQELLEEYHAWLSAHEVDAESDDADQTVTWLSEYITRNN